MAEDIGIDIASSVHLYLNVTCCRHLGKVTAKEDIEIEMSGAGEIKANVFCQDLSIEINGAGEAVLSGECKGTFSCEQNGASKIDTSNLKR